MAINCVMRTSFVDELFVPGAEVPHLTFDFFCRLTGCVCKLREIFVWFLRLLCLGMHVTKILPGVVSGVVSLKTIVHRRSRLVNKPVF